MRSHPSDLICSSASSGSPSLADGVGERRERGSTELETSRAIRLKLVGGRSGLLDEEEFPAPGWAGADDDDADAPVPDGPGPGGEGTGVDADMAGSLSGAFSGTFLYYTKQKNGFSGGESGRILLSAISFFSFLLPPQKFSPSGSGGAGRKNSSIA